MLWVPRLSDDVAKVAWRAAFSVPVPMSMPPSRNLTVPVGTPAPGETAVTVTVKVIVSPEHAGFIGETSAVLVFARLTVCPATNAPPLEL